MLRNAFHVDTFSQPKQEEVYYLHVANRSMGETSPYFELFKRKGIEVLFVYGIADEVVLQNVVDYRGKKVVSCESAHIDVSSFPDDPSFKQPESESKVDFFFFFFFFFFFIFFFFFFFFFFFIFLFLFGSLSFSKDRSWRGKTHW